MDAAREKTVSKFMSLVLRHEPEALGVTLDGEGWTDLDDLSAGLYLKFGVTRDDVLGIVTRDGKGRYTVSGNRIRAAQGHSLDVSLGFKAHSPPARLFHGTTAAAWTSIEGEGLRRMARTHVHLSADLETARTVGSRRRGALVILEIAAGVMAGAGFVFYLSENGVWLTESVPPQYVTRSQSP